SNCHLLEFNAVASTRFVFLSEPLSNIPLKRPSKVADMLESWSFHPLWFLPGPWLWGFQRQQNMLRILLDKILFFQKKTMFWRERGEEETCKFRIPKDVS